MIVGKRSDRICEVFLGRKFAYVSWRRDGCRTSLLCVDGFSSNCLAILYIGEGRIVFGEEMATIGGTASILNQN